MNEIVTFVDQIPRHKALEEMAKSHVLLLFASGQPLQIPGKLYEYFGLKASILAICDSGATKNILKDYLKVVIVPPDDSEAMRKGILTLMGLNGGKFGTKDISNYEEFGKKLLTKKLSKILTLVS